MSGLETAEYFASLPLLHKLRYLGQIIGQTASQTNSELLLNSLLSTIQSGYKELLVVDGGVHGGVQVAGVHHCQDVSHLQVLPWGGEWKVDLRDSLNILSLELALS